MNIPFLVAWTLMNEEWLKTLQSIIQQDLLLLGYAEKTFFQNLIITLLEYLKPETSEILVKRNLVSAKMMINAYEPENIIKSYIFNNLKKIFNDILEIQKLYTKNIEPLEVQPEEKNTESKILENLSLFASYRRLKANIEIKDENEDEKKIFDELEKQMSNHPKGTLAHYGFTYIRDYKSDEKNNVQLSNALKLIWKAINKLPQTIANDTKTDLIDHLAKIHEHAMRYQEKKTSSEHILLTLFQVINRKTPDVFIINSASQLPQLIKSRCHTLLELKIQTHSNEEQSFLFHHIDEKEHEENKKFWGNFAENSQQVLEKEFSVFNLLQNKNIQKEIQDYIQEYINESNTSHWLKENIRNGHYNTFKISNNNSFDKKQSLVRCLNLEIKCTKNEERNKITKILREQAVKVHSTQKSIIDNLCMRFEKVIGIDKFRHQLDEIKEKKETFGWRMVFSLFDEKMKHCEKLINDAYAELKFENRNTHYQSLSAHCHNLKAQADNLQKKLIRFKDENQSIFSPDYEHRPSYFALTEELKEHPLDKIKSLFHDYASKGFLYFHWKRHHAKEARQVIAHLDSLKNESNNLELAKEYLKNIKNTLYVKNLLNITGSFSRRIEFSLQLLEESSTPKSNLLSQSPPLHQPFKSSSLDEKRLR